MISETWRLNVVDFAWTDQYAVNHNWAWTYNQAAYYCNSHLCEIVDLRPKHLLPSLSGDRGITHHWITVKMLSGPKKGDIIIVAKAWLNFLTEKLGIQVPDGSLNESVGNWKSEKRGEVSVNTFIGHTAALPALTLPEPINWGSSLKRYNDNHREKKNPSRVKYIIATVMLLATLVVGLLELMVNI